MGSRRHQPEGCRTRCTTNQASVARYLPRAPWTELPTNTHRSMTTQQMPFSKMSQYTKTFSLGTATSKRSPIMHVRDETKHMSAWRKEPQGTIVRNFQTKDKWPLALIKDRMTSGRHNPVDRHASKEVHLVGLPSQTLNVRGSCLLQIDTPVTHN